VVSQPIRAARRKPVDQRCQYDYLRQHAGMSPGLRRGALERLDTDYVTDPAAFGIGF